MRFFVAAEEMVLRLNDKWERNDRVLVSDVLREMYSLARAERDAEWCQALAEHTKALCIIGDDIKSATKYVGYAIEDAEADARAETAKEVIEAAANILESEVQRHRSEEWNTGKHFCEDYGCGTLERFAGEIRALASRYTETPTTSCAAEAPAAPHPKDSRTE